MHVPIACALSATAAHRQVDEWQALLAEVSAGSERSSTTQLSVRLVDDPDLVASVIALARREKACCPFFEFTLRIEAETVSLHIGVPEDATALLDDFASVASGRVTE